MRSPHAGRQRFALCWVSLILLLVPLLAVAPPQPAMAAGVVSDCTETALRNALAGGGLVTFSCSGTIPIASQIEINANTTIVGGGTITLDGGGTTRLLVVTANVEVTLTGLTLAGGRASGDIEAGDGGAIVNAGVMTIVDSTFTGNSAQRDGGAIRNEGTLTLIAGTLSGNSSQRDGGAIRNVGTLTVTASTLSGNSAVNSGGAIRNDGTVTLVASTVSGNGIINLVGTLTITASTLSGNSISNFFGTVTFTASILSGSLCDGAFASGGYNVASDASCNLTGAGDLQNADPLLGALQDNGGPTFTHLPQPSSPAIDRVPAATCVTLSAANDGRDQRGTVRPGAETSCDSGAVEHDGAVPIWLLAAYAFPVQGQDYTLVAIASGPAAAILGYTFHCPSGDVGPQASATTTCTFPTPPSNAAALVTVSILDVTPVVTLAPDAVILGEGGSYQGAGAFTSEGLGSWDATIDYGDGSPPQGLGSVTPGVDIPINHQYLNVGSYTITLTVCDTTVNRCGEDSAAVTVTAVAPSVTITPVSLNLGQGDTFHASGAFTDPGRGPWTATVDYGQGAGPQALAIGPGNTFSLIRPYLQQGSFPVTVEVCDPTTACGSATVTVVVGNLPPVIDTITGTVAGSQVRLVVAAFDPGGGPLRYRFTCAGRTIGPQSSPEALCDYGHQTGTFLVLVEVIDANQVVTSQTLAVELATYLCVGERSGTPRLMDSPGGCLRGERSLVLNAANTADFCVGERSGSLRYLASGGCLRGEWLLTLPEDGPITVCVGQRSGRMHLVTTPSCLRGELVYRLANRVG